MFEIILGVLTPILLATIAYLYNRKQELEKQLMGEKRKLYSEFIKFQMTAIPKHSQDKEEFAKMVEEQMPIYAAKFMIFGSPKVIKQFNKLRGYGLKSKDETKNVLYKFGELALFMRKDMGLANKHLAWKDLIQMFLNEDIDKALS